MLREKMVQRLNEQVNLEMYSSNIYLAMSAWCANKGLHGSAKFLKDHSKEELSHATNFLTISTKPEQSLP